MGHPPGAPLFMMVARFFTLFASDVTKVAALVNAMSALASAFTILFLFWTITHLALVIIKDAENISTGNLVAVMASELVGALAYTFFRHFLVLGRRARFTPCHRSLPPLFSGQC